MTSQRAARVTVTRRGGLAGVALTGSGSVADLPPQEAAAARDALAATDWDAAPQRPQHPDAFTYEIAVETAGERRARRFAEHELPDALRPLVRQLLR